MKTLTTGFFCCLLLLLVVFSLATPVRAEESEEKLKFHGYGTWGFGDTNGNQYLLGKKDGNYNNFQFSLNTAANPSKDLRINAQFSWVESESENSVKADYGFAEWRFADTLRMRVGKVKQPFGIYNEIYDIGTARPFYTLPQGIYGSTGVICQSYRGLGFTGTYYFTDEWGVDYDLYGGQLDLDFEHNLILPMILPLYQQAKTGLAQAEAGKLQAEAAAQFAAQAKAAAEAAGNTAGAAQAEAQYNTYMQAAAQAEAGAQQARAGMTQMASYPTISSAGVKIKDLVGGKINIHTPYYIIFGGSLFSGKFSSFSGEMGVSSNESIGELEEQTNVNIGAHLEFIYDTFTLRSEYAHVKLGDWVKSNTAYGEASYLFLKHWQIAARYDWIDKDYDVPGMDVSSLPSIKKQTEWSGGVNYWFDSNFVIKASYHAVEGNHYATPESMAEFLESGGLKEHTQLVIVGAQFNF